MTAGKIFSWLLLCLILFQCEQKRKENSTHLLENTTSAPIDWEQFSLADDFFHSDRYDSAALIYQSIFRNSEGRNSLYAINQAATAYIYLQKYKTALNTLDEADELINGIDPHDSLLAQHYYNYGLAFNYLNEGDSSIYYHLKSLEIRRKTLNSPHIHLAESFIGLGNVNTYSLYNYTQGQEYYEKALSEIHALKDTTQSEVLLRCYYNLANIHKTLRNLDRAEYFARGALELAINIDNTVFQKYCHNMIAIILNFKGDFENSLDHYQQVIELLKTETSQDYYFIGITYFNIALNYFDHEDYQDAIEWIEKAIHLFRKWELTDNVHFTDLLIHHGWAKLNMEEDTSYIDVINQAVNQLKEFDDGKNSLVNAYALLSGYYINQKDYQKAIDILNTGISLLRKNSGDSTEIFYNNFKAYEFFRDLGEAQLLLFKTNNNLSLIKSALDNYLKSDSLLNILKSKNLLESDEIDLNKMTQKDSENAVKCIKILSERGMNNQLLPAALKITEQNKNRILYKAVKIAERQNTAGVPDSLIQKWRDINQQINHLQNNNSNNRVKERLLELTKDMELLTNYLKSHYPNYVKYAFGSHEEITIDSLEDYAKKNRAVLINYFYGEEYIMALSVTPDSSTIHFILNDTIFQEHLYTYRSSFVHIEPTSKEKYTSFMNSSNFLHDALFSKSLNDFQDNIEKVIIIPDKDLSQIPFESLLSSKPKSDDIDYKNLDYLVKNYEVSYHHSFSFLIQSQSNQSVKNPKLGGWGYEKLNYKDPPLPTLPTAVKELDKVSKGFNSKLFKERKATETSFKKSNDEFDLIHLSIHGTSSYHGQPCLFFNADSINDGKMYASELYNLKNKSNLIVLGSCESGIGEIIPGEGIMNIARGFFYTGCPSIIINLSEVVDRSSIALQEEFYENLKSGKSKGKALQLAKLRHINNADKYTSHPAFWAPPVLMGSNDEIIDEDRTLIKIIAIIIILIIAIISWKVVSRTSANK